MKSSILTNNYNLMSKRTIYYSYMAVFTVFVIFGFISQLDLNYHKISINKIISTFFVFDIFLIEFLILLIIGEILLYKKLILRIILYIITSLYIFIYFIQFMSFYKVNEMVSPLAIDNINHISLIINTNTVLLLVLLSLLCLFLPVFIETRSYGMRQNTNKNIVFSLIIVSSLLVFLQISDWIPKSVMIQRNNYLEDNYLQHSAPVSALYSSLFLQGSPSLQDRSDFVFTPYELHEVNNFGFQYDSSNEYPFIKDNIYSGLPPFKKLPGAPETPNIIVFFTEGFSARSTNIYGSQYPGITPHIDNFAANSMVVHNYYNHTAATYRGLHGQLCSLFPTFGGLWRSKNNDLPEIDYYCLSNVFNKNGYETIFLDAHMADKAQVDEMLRELDFKTVITGDVLSEKYLNSAGPQMKDALSDGQFFRGLIGFLEERAEKNQMDTPFFMGLYNLGTHAFVGLARDGKKYGKGSNISLNTIHNLDSAFGQFWDYYQKSPYAQNTIVIFTADHCHYQEKPFVKAFDGPGYQKITVDKIPLVIHDPTRELPETFDAQNSTSLDFTPSLIHYLDLGNHKNPFLGTSIYEQQRKEYATFGLNSIGEKLYLIDSEKIHIFDSSKKHHLRLTIMNKFILASKQYELANKLWDKSLNSEL